MRMVHRFNGQLRDFATWKAGLEINQHFNLKSQAQ